VNHRESGCFSVTRFSPHTCDASEQVRISAKRSQLVNLIRSKTSGVRVKPKEVRKILEQENVQASERSSYYVAKVVNSDSLSIEQSTALIPSLLTSLSEANPDSILCWSQNEDSKELHYVFVCFGACRAAFEHCTPVLAVDGCHLSHPNARVLLSCCSLDGNGKMVPLAFAFVLSECHETWSSFLNDLDRALGLKERRDIVLISDRQKGLQSAQHAVLPAAHPSYCTVHIARNAARLLPGTKWKEINALLHRYATIRDRETFDAFMRIEMKALYPALHAYLSGIAPSTWSDAYFPVPRFGHVTSNLAECFNAWILSVRDQSLYRLLISLTTLLSKLYRSRFVSNRLVAAQEKTRIPKALRSEIDFVQGCESRSST
jgi:MULE transposase domain